jgi:hypothetical protein
MPTATFAPAHQPAASPPRTDRANATSLAQSLLTTLRTLREVWVEARALEAAAWRRYPHLRG